MNRQSLHLAFIISFLLLIFSPSLAEEELTPNRAITDLSGWISSPLRGNPSDYILAGSVLGFCGLCYAYDKPWSDNLQQLDENADIHNSAQVLSLIGKNWVVASSIGAVGLTGLILNDRSILEETWALGESFAYTAVLAEVLKKSAGRARPTQSDNAYDFHGFSMDYDSFPSGHATTAGALAGCIVRRHPDSWIIVPAVVLAGSIGLSRLTLGKHYPSDVAAGMALGFWGGYNLGKPYFTLQKLGFDNQGWFHLGFSLDVY